MPMYSVTFTKPLNDKVAAVNEASLGDITHITKEKDPIQAKEKLSFASVMNEQPLKKAVKIKELRNELSVNSAAVTIPIEVIEAVNARSTYARALIEILADVDLMDSLVIAIPRCDKEGHTFATIDIEYEWTPPRCASCKIFDHVSDKCPKLPREVSNMKISDDGFTEVKKMKVRTKKSSKKQVEGVRLSKPALNLQYRRVEKDETSKQKVSSNENKKNVGNGSSKPLVEPIKVTTSNSFSALEEDDSRTWDEDNGGTNDNAFHVVNDSDMWGGSDSEGCGMSINYNEREYKNKNYSQESSNGQEATLPVRTCFLMINVGSWNY
ncbi:hypothetical protein Tco_1144745 [Tanacetum coccineum]